ncbi:TIGR04282 family arsenosugar biosynthesis glycosyltransferase [Wenyingzhuangia sp. IMCC45533]
MSSQLLIIFTRRPELGKVKTRLAAETSDQTALNVYNQLLEYTHSITKDIEVDKWVFYTDEIEFNDLWDEGEYMKMIQAQGDLGTKMQEAVFKGFGAGYLEIVVIGSDVDTLTSEIIQEAFDQVKEQNVIGPAEDGGYYLLGLNEPRTDVFSNKEWGTDTVLRDTLINFENEEIYLLEELNDIDYLEDITEESFLFPLIETYKQKIKR